MCSASVVGFFRPYDRNTGWKPMLHYAVASPLQVHGDSSRDGSERSYDSPENKVA
jgi:hypothetical protein